MKGRQAQPKLDVLPRPSNGAPAAAPAAAEGGLLDTAWRREQLISLVELSERLTTLTDLNAILETVAGAVMQALDPPACALSLLDEGGSGLAVSIMRGLDPARAEWWRSTGSQALGLPVTAIPIEPAWPHELAAGAPGGVLRVPLIVPGQTPVGALDLFTATPAPLEPSDAATLRAITIQAGAAVAASRARLREVLAVYTIAQSINGRIDLTQLARSVLQAVATLLRVSGGAIVLADEHQPIGTRPRIVAHLGAALRPAAADEVLARAIERTAPFILAQVAPMPVLAAGLEGIGLAAPLWLERKLLGVMMLAYPHVRAFQQSDLWLLSAIGSQVTMALRNAQLYHWSEELAIAEERGRIAREIHDGLAQSLAHKILKLDLCRRLIGRDEARLQQELEALQASVRSDIQDVRHSILALRPPDLEQRGLREAVQAYVDQFSRDSGVRISAELAPLEGIAPKIQTAIFRLVQEALNNIRKHAGAGTAGVSILADGAGDLILRISDDGRGFDVDAALQREPGQQGIGLRGMVERTLAAEGTIEIDSRPGHGTRIEIRLPAQ